MTHEPIESPPAVLPASPDAGLIRATTGWASIALGVLLLPTPLPLGALLLAFGLACLGPRNPWVRRVAATVLMASRRGARRGNPLAKWVLKSTLALRHAVQRLRSSFRARG